MPESSWAGQSARTSLYHGCTDRSADAIQSHGVRLGLGRPRLDFGPGFYTTTNRDQARRWALAKYSNLQGIARPRILHFRVPLERLARLDSLMFVRGDASYPAFWGLVQWCRSGGSHRHPGRPAPEDWYDVVCGPVAGSWPPELPRAIPDFDQFSFHTAAGIAILNDLIDQGRPGFDVIAL